MSSIQRAYSRLASIPNVTVRTDASLADFTRFGIGGPAAILADASTEESFIFAIRQIRESGVPMEIIGGGSNLLCSDDGFDGIILRYIAQRVDSQDTSVSFDAGAVLQDVVDFSIDRGLAGIHTMTGIPGWTGGAVYGNAGAYGRSIHESVVRVRFFDGADIREFNNEQCQFRYRESIFKQRKDWIIFSAELQLTRADSAELRRQADEILATRNAKYPPTMKCAGSIFKNIIFAELPEGVRAEVPPKMIREGKVPSAWFLEQVDAKGIRNGGIHVADYHANLIYNADGGTARQVREIIDDLKARIVSRFGFSLEEEVQYIGFR